MEKLITNPHHSKADLGHFDFELVLRKPKLQLGILSKCFTITNLKLTVESAPRCKRDAAE